MEPSKLVMGISDNLAQLMQLISKQKGMEEEAQGLAAIMSSFQGWAEQMNQAPGEGEEMMKGPMPMMAGAKKVTPAL